MPDRDPASRYADRAADYAKHRPGYPDALRVALLAAGHLRPADDVADLGSGTGLLSALFLAAGCRVFAIEPGAEMRRQAEARFAREPRFVSVNGRAEATTLPDASVDLSAAGQAFHWFDQDAARTEFLRITRPPGRALLVWNVRRADTSPFMTEYETLLREHATEPAVLSGHDPEEPALRRFFAGALPAPLVFHHHQIFDAGGLRGRLLSSSYLPAAAAPGGAAMLEALQRLFARHQKDGIVRFDYETRAYAGVLKR
jgi:SAM-dependent methyltransferase